MLNAYAPSICIWFYFASLWTVFRQWQTILCFVPRLLAGLILKPSYLSFVFRSLWPIFSNVWTFFDLSNRTSSIQTSVSFMRSWIYVRFLTHMVHLIRWTLILCWCAKWAEVHTDLYLQHLFFVHSITSTLPFVSILYQPRIYIIHKMGLLVISL